MCRTASGRRRRAGHEGARAGVDRLAQVARLGEDVRRHGDLGGLGHDAGLDQPDLEIARRDEGLDAAPPALAQGVREVEAGRPPSQYHHGSPVASGRSRSSGRSWTGRSGGITGRLAVNWLRASRDSLTRPWPTPPPPPTTSCSAAPSSSPRSSGAGEISARDLVERLAGAHRGARPALNAFVDVDADGRSPPRPRSAAGDARPFAGVPIAIKNNRRSPACADLLRRPLAATSSRRTTTTSSRACAPPASSSSGARRCPSAGSCRRPSRAASARRATRGTSRARPAAPRAASAPRSRPAWSRSRTPTTAAARSASRRPAAASSASSRSAAASR